MRASAPLCSLLDVMVDETTDKSNKEELTLVVNWVSVQRVPGPGLHCFSATDTQSIVSVMKDVFQQFQIPLAKVCGYCYDGCSTI